MLTKLLRTQLRPHRRKLAALMSCHLIQVTGTLMLPTLNAAIIDKGVVRGDMPLIMRMGAAMIVVTVLQVICQLTAVYLGSGVATAMARDLRSLLFRRVQDFSERDVGQFGTPSLVTRSVNDVDQVQTMAISLFDVAIPAPIMCVCAVLLAMNQDVPLSGLLVAVMIVIAVAVVVLLARMSPLYGAMQRYLDKINHILREQVTGVQVVRAFVSTERERERFAGANNEMFAIARRVGKLTATLPPIVMFAMNAFSVALLWLGAGRIDAGHMQPGALNALLSYLGLCVMSITMAMIMLMNVPRARVSAERIQEVLDTVTSVPAPSKAADANIGCGAVEMREVTFSYPGAQEPVLHGINLSVSPGETVAVLGSTGCGKTTLLNLVIRLFDATGGAVLVNGIDVRLTDPERLPGIVALVPQTPYLFTGTIASNLRFGRPDSTDEDLWHALDVVQAREFVERLPDGLNTRTGQGGSELSGGQRQRLGIARAILCRAQVYLLDDCFSALDYGTAAAVQATLTEELASATVIMVAQRVATVRSADRIVVLNDGRIVGTGTHEELARDNETYREIADSQLAVSGAS